jgi:type III secretion protein R
MGSSYIKVSVVISMVKNALGLSQTPGVVVELALAIALSLIVMAPVFEACLLAIPDGKWQELTKSPSPKTLLELKVALTPWAQFLDKHSGIREKEAFLSLSQVKEIPVEAPKKSERSYPLKVLIPAFMVSELKEAFLMGFIILIPFLLIDLIVAQVLTGIGLTSLTPSVVTMPIKIILFVAADGWLFLTTSLIKSYS